MYGLTIITLPHALTSTNPSGSSFVSVRSCQFSLRSAAHTHSPAPDHRRRKLSEVSWKGQEGLIMAQRTPARDLQYRLKSSGHIFKSTCLILKKKKSLEMSNLSAHACKCFFALSVCVYVSGIP